MELADYPVARFTIDAQGPCGAPGSSKITLFNFLHHKAQLLMREGQGLRPHGDRNDGSTMEGFSVSEADSSERTTVHSTMC